MKCPKCQCETPGELRSCGNCGAPLAPPGKAFDPNKTETLTCSSGELLDGTLFAGRYLVLGELGRGGMGCVYRALDTKVDEEVALKFINPDIASDAKIIERFRTELKVTRRITHRHVCRMYDLSADGGSLFITMEYIPGEDLAAMTRRLGKLPLEKAFVIARQVAEGLAEVHRLGVIHRDLKPKNIMIDRDGEAKIMDFGLARTPHGVKFTEVGRVVGTPSFMSPEQINGETIDGRSDIFALGVVMFSMLTGALPFKAESTLALALLHKTHTPPNPHALNPRVPESIGRIVLKCLEIDKDKRYPSARDLLADLDKVSDAFDTYAVHVPGRSGRKAAGRPSRPVWIRVLAGASIVLALAASGLAIRTLLRKSPAAVVPAPVVKVPEPVEPDEKETAAVVEREKVKGVAATFVTVPSRATVFVDEIEMGITDDTFLISPGRHAVRISKPGYRDFLATLAADPGGPKLRREYTLVPQPPTLGTLNITSEPSEADVFLDGSPKPAGRTPFVLGLTPGKVRVKVGLAGYHEQTEDVDVHAGERSALYCPLSPRDGTVEISSDPAGAEVSSNGEIIGRTPFTRQLKPAVYRLKISLKGRGGLEDIISVHPGESLPPLHYTLAMPRTAPKRYFLKVTSDPSGAAVTINGVLQKEPTPFVWELDTPEVRLKLEKGDLRSQEEVIVLRPAPARNEKSFALKRAD